MSLFSALLVTLVAQAVVALPAPLEDIPDISARAQTCHSYVLISSRGTFEPQGPSVGFVGMIGQTLAAVPGGVEYDTVYPAMVDNEEYVGAADIVRYINAGLQACPAQVYGLLGYSQGATVVSDALGNLTDPASSAYSPAAVGAIKSVVVIGNPVHKAHQAANVDQRGGKSTNDYKGSLVGFLGRTYIPASIYASGRLLDICYTNDLVCVGPTVGSVVSLGGPHLLYGPTKSVQDEGAKFMISQLA